MPIQLLIFLSNIAITIVKHSQNSSIKKVSWFPVRCRIDHLSLTVHQISDSITVTHFTIVNKKLKSFNISCVIIFLPMIHASLDQGDKIKLLTMIFTNHTLLLSLYGLRKQIYISAALQSSTHSNPDVTDADAVLHEMSNEASWELVVLYACVIVFDCFNHTGLRHRSLFTVNPTER